MTKPKPRPARAVDAVRAALDRDMRKRPDGMKPIEIVKVALCAYQAYQLDPKSVSPTVESADRQGLRRGTQASMDRLLFNVNYWLSAYEDRIVSACDDADAAEACLKAIAAWNSHTMKLNTLSNGEVVSLFERFCPPFSVNNRRGDAVSAGRGKGPVHDFERYVQTLRSHDDESEEQGLGHIEPNGGTVQALESIVASVKEEAQGYEQYRDTPPLDAFYDLLPAWCLQDQIDLLRSTWWNDADVMSLIAERLRDRFLEIGHAEPLCCYFFDAMREAIDNYTRTVTSEESPYRETPVPELIEIVRNARAAHPDSEIEGYGNELPAWLDSKEQMVWNTIVCAVYGPMHTRPLLADNLEALPVEGQAASSDVITDMARRAYARYLDTRRESGVTPEFAAFETQTEDLRNSGLERIESIPRMLEVLGYRIVPLASCYPEQRVETLKASEVECLAILEHRRWLEERRSAGWELANYKDVEAKKSPYLIDWDDLPDRAREWTRCAVRDIPSLLCGAGLAISR